MTEYVNPQTYNERKAKRGHRWPCAVWGCDAPVSAQGEICRGCRRAFGPMIAGVEWGGR